MKGLVSSKEEMDREKLFAFDEAMEVNYNAHVLQCALLSRSYRPTHLDNLRLNEEISRTDFSLFFMI